MVQEKKTDDQIKEDATKQQKDVAAGRTSDPLHLRPAPLSRQAAAAPKPYVVREALQSIVALIEKSVKSKETRLQSGRLLRQTAVARRHLGAADLAAFLEAHLPAESPAKTYLVGLVEKLGSTAAAPMEDDSAAAAAAGGGGTAAAAAVVPSALPEVELYAYLLVLVFAIDKGAIEEASDAADRAVARLRDFNRRTLDVIASRIYFYYG
ncbi:26S proteasome regulatory subunit [Monoraphidium neglectum]|uniref:26S proteasome regulatory subunit n=1 Tax=Monoraphidium neglectum TaxID=145388 RepID=A0A0D2NAM1_9CHLO|nr:26S proteasome regulatory subunit [Monoraphidium neglectum]KIZ02596.1 26S proteasome regulatory subunit [Monoraphidium neglectum]|eukprot:XP_013901615.1 26S proteasome regulatory subunit [Monoraphidium neglectum]